MKESNIDLFNTFAGELLERLFNKFPVEQDIRVEEFSYLDNETNSDIFSSSVRFLHREGFIRYSQAGYGSFVGVVLTAQGLTVLNSIPELLKVKESVGNKIGSALKSGSSEVIKAIIREIVKISMQ